MVWSDPNRQHAEVICFLEGPAFDRQGNLYIVDTPFGRIFRIDPKGEWDLVVQYDGWPNGMKFHKDGRPLHRGLPEGHPRARHEDAKLETVLETAYSEGFKGCNDLHFTSTGDLYFTDQGQTGIADPTGRLFRLRADGALDRLVTNVPSPNGVTVSTTEKHVYVGVTRSQQVWRLPVMHDMASPRPASRSSSPAASAGPTASRWMRTTDSWCASSASASGASTRTCCRRTSSTRGLANHHHLANIASAAPIARRLTDITESLSGRRA